MNDIEVIGIDHGWSHIKTITNVFTTAVEINGKPTFFDNILEYQGKCYSIGGSRLEVRNTKVENEDFYLLTLAAIAKELKHRGKNKANIYLAVGLPLTRFGDEKADFINYLSKNKNIQFAFGKEAYDITIEKVSVYPQCYSAIAEMIPGFQRKVLVVDIGSWTIDIMPVINKKPDDIRCNSLPHGLITCMRDINRICMKEHNYEVDEMDIECFIQGNKTNIPAEIVTIIEEKLTDYTQMVMGLLKEFEINIRSTPIVFVGGGSSVMKRFGHINDGNVDYKLDVKANAKGYETLAKIALKNWR